MLWGLLFMALKDLRLKLFVCEKSFTLKAKWQKILKMLKRETLIINKRFLKRNGAYSYMDAQTSLRAVSPRIMLLLVLV